MPLGVICNVLAVAAGGILGARMGSKLSPEFREKLNQVFGICSAGIGISSVMLMKNISAPAVTIECGFLSNAREEALLRQDSYQTKIAAAIAGGYIRYLYGS